jgi:hypothetical protein
VYTTHLYSIHWQTIDRDVVRVRVPACRSVHVPPVAGCVRE